MTDHLMEQAKSLFVLGSFVVACSVKTTRLPQPGESMCAEAFTLEPGGKGFNLAVGAHRLGAAVDGVLAVGDDLFGQLVEPALTQAGLSLTVVRRPRATTGSGVGFVDAAGENCLAVYPGANLKLSAADVRASSAALRRAELILAQFEIGDEPIGEAFALAREAGRMTLLNPSPFRTPDLRILEQTSMLVLNETEATQLSAWLGEDVAPMRDHERRSRMMHLAQVLHDRGPDTVIVTLGANGALACRRGAEPIMQPAFPVEASDTLGAGDAFTAGLAVSLLQGRPLAESLTRAAACGALVAQRLGVLDALPRQQELDHFLSTAIEPSS